MSLWCSCAANYLNERGCISDRLWSSSLNRRLQQYKHWRRQWPTLIFIAECVTSDAVFFLSAACEDSRDDARDVYDAAEEVKSGIGFLIPSFAKKTAPSWLFSPWITSHDEVLKSKELKPVDHTGIDAIVPVYV